MKNYPFKGVDQDELKKAWNIANINEGCSQSLLYFLEGVIVRYLSGKGCFVVRKVAKDIRLYVEQLAKNESYGDAPLWAGLAKITDDYILVYYTKKLIMDMWLFDIDL